MIRFNCPHCGNEFAVRDTYAGRDGWCRVCKELVLVPTEDGKGPLLDDLPMEDRISRLRAKLKYAATQADTYKQITLRIWTEVDELLLGRDSKDRKLTPDGIEASLKAWRTAWDARSAQPAPPRADPAELKRLQVEVSELRTALEKKSRAFVDVNEEADRLRAAIASLELELADKSVAAPASEDHAEKDEVNAYGEIASHTGVAANGDVNALREALAAARIALAELEATKTDTESALHAIHAELAAAQAEREDAKRATRVLQDEVESLRVELDAALYANSGNASQDTLVANGVAEAQAREAALREELTAARLKLAEIEAKKTDAENALATVSNASATAQAEREEARRAAQVLQDEVESLRIELDAALHANAGYNVDDIAESEAAFAVADGQDDGRSDNTNYPDRDGASKDAERDSPNGPPWHAAPVVVMPPDGHAAVPAQEMEVVEAEIEGLDPFENDAMMSSYLHFLSDAPGRGK